ARVPQTHRGAVEGRAAVGRGTLKHRSVMPGLVPGIHAFLFEICRSKTWMAGSSPAMTEYYSGWMPAALISSPRTFRPSLTVSASSVGELATTTRPRLASFALTASVLRIFAIAVLSCAMIGCGVPAGANSPTQDDISKPGTVSPMVGTSGIAA